MVATATEEVFSIRRGTQGVVEIECFRLMGIANPPVAIGNGGWIELLTVKSVIKGKHTVKGSSGFHLDLARCRGARGNDGGQGTIVGDAQATEPVAVRTEINGVAADIGVVCDAKQATGLDLNVARAERCTYTTEGGSNGADRSGIGRAPNDGAASIIVAWIEHRDGTIAKLLNAAGARNQPFEGGLGQSIEGAIDTGFWSQGGGAPHPQTALKRQRDDAIAVHHGSIRIIGNREVGNASVLCLAVVSEGGVSADKNVGVKQSLRTGP